MFNKLQITGMEEQGSVSEIKLLNPHAEASYHNQKRQVIFYKTWTEVMHPGSSSNKEVWDSHQLGVWLCNVLLHVDCVVLGVLERRGGAEKQESRNEVVILERREPGKKKAGILATRKIWKVSFLQLLISSSLRRLRDNFKTIYYI